MGVDTVSQPISQTIEGYSAPEYAPASEDLIGHELVDGLKEAAERDLQVASIAADAKEVTIFRHFRLESSQAITVTAEKQTTGFPIPKTTFTRSVS